MIPMIRGARIDFRNQTTDKKKSSYGYRSIGTETAGIIYKYTKRFAYCSTVSAVSYRNHVLSPPVEEVLIVTRNHIYMYISYENGK